MRGKPKNIKSLIINGNLYLKYEDEEQLAIPQKGDIMFYLNDDASPKSGMLGNYFDKGYAGYFKMDIFDGKEWQGLNMEEFFDHKEYQFHKKEVPIDCYNLCKEAMENFTNLPVYYNYRGHYTNHLHVQNDYIRNKKQLTKKKKKLTK
ncbi:hypothetical protein [Rickettsiales endosymbiont of Stachyamoeba lipophora]|uniref:hypothetical protein n=1 Tax=Rickettsiales endosymbiont of Stachyamoeba lipophora TaxID=2486578 RepID=UPI000F64D4BB|nr:hypothetical protein [Rickettsiales endosymbiont of Stachyamoeba lipophora]AZL15124.1 hypothetical protein EF513_00910 [Rickettsiales endosymbiont of Stachyamoeba lipophora]